MKTRHLIVFLSLSIFVHRLTLNQQLRSWVVRENRSECGSDKASPHDYEGLKNLSRALRGAATRVSVFVKVFGGPILFGK